MSLPEVSVVIPTYNRATFLPASLQSVLDQKDVALEVIVVDDGSTDGTAAWLATVRDPRLTVVTGAHAGIAAARNRGMALARAPLIAFHDSDDLALPGRLAIPVAHLRAHQELDFVILNGRLLPPEDAPQAVERPWIAPEVARGLMDRSLGVGEVFRWNLGQLQGMCFRRRGLERVGPLDTSFRILDDLDLVLRAGIVGRGVFLDRPGFAYRQHAGGVARNRLTVREESIRLADKLVREHPEVLPQLGGRQFLRRQARRWARLAALRAHAGDRTGARLAVARACSLAPRSLRYRWQALRYRWSV